MILSVGMTVWTEQEGFDPTGTVVAVGLIVVPISAEVVAIGEVAEGEICVRRYVRRCVRMC